MDFGLDFNQSPDHHDTMTFKCVLLVLLVFTVVLLQGCVSLNW